MITGTWHGKINKQKVEVKIIQKGDSLTGTSYYYESANHFRRYSIKGYFDRETNSAVWWDDELIDERAGKFSLSSPGKLPMLSRADFNCPGGARMMLDGKAALKQDEMKPRGDVHLDKVEDANFQDEWDYVIENYTVGASDPDIIDSIAALAQAVPVSVPVAPEQEQKQEQKNTEVVYIPEPTPKPVVKPLTIAEKFTTREKLFIKEIPVSGDSIELRFYDNAEIDGDSISLFLNGKIIFEHIRLTEKAYRVKFAVADLLESNELIMVAENLGAIPPNTSYMVALVEDKRYEAQLASTEKSSAMIRFVKK